MPTPHPAPLPAGGEREGPREAREGEGQASGVGGNAVSGIAEIRFSVRDGATRLAHLYQRDPLRVLFPAHEAGDPSLAVLITTSGGLVAGDDIRVAIRLEPGAAAHVTASAAEKIYRSTGATTAITQEVSVKGAAWLEYLPQETILFDGARLRRHTRLALAPSAGFLGGGILVFGRRARGEGFSHGFLHERWEISRDGALTWADALHLDGDIAAIIADPACFDGAAACATLILAPPQGKPQAFVADARAIQQQSSEPGLQAGVSAIGGLLVARWLGPDAQTVRRAYADLACHLRQAAVGLPARLPRLWHV